MKTSDFKMWNGTRVFPDNINLGLHAAHNITTAITHTLQSKEQRKSTERNNDDDDDDYDDDNDDILPNILYCPCTEGDISLAEVLGLSGKDPLFSLVTQGPEGLSDYILHKMTTSFISAVTVSRVGSFSPVGSFSLIGSFKHKLIHLLTPLFVVIMY